MKQRKRIRIIILLLIICLVIVSLLSVCIGNYSISVPDLITYFVQRVKGLSYNKGLETVLINIRLVRIVAAILIGAALSVSGNVYQTVFSNKIASPDLLGVSSSAACGAGVAIVCGLSSNLIFFASFAFSIMSILFTGIMAKLLNRRDGLLLSGIIVGGLAKSFLGLLKYFFADSETGSLQSIVYWELGSMSKISWKQIFTVAPAIALVMIFMFLMRNRISCLAFGESASLLGIHVSIERIIAIVLASLLVSLSTAICGIVSWVCLVIPLASSELSKSGSFSDNIGITALLGSVFLLVCDTVARAATTSEIPISIMTGAAGLIIFCVSVFKKKEKHII